MIPPLVERARAVAVAPDCGDDLGRLLHVLAGQRGRTRVAQIGGGVEAAWIVSALAPGVPFLCVGPPLPLFADDPDVRVLEGEWHDVLPREAPFDLLVARGLTDVGLVELLAPGGTLVAGAPLVHPRLFTAELELASRELVIVGTLQA